MGFALRAVIHISGLLRVPNDGRLLEKIYKKEEFQRLNGA
jgi:hypothetical protein